MKIKILSLNIWGLPDVITSLAYRSEYAGLAEPGTFLFANKTERVRALAHRLHEFGDIICLEEAWAEDDRTVIKSAAAEHGLVHSHYYRHHFVGCGLLLLSRFPIANVHLKIFSLNGNPRQFLHGDWYAGKGAALAVLDVGDGSLVNVLFTHTIANYSDVGKPDEYLGHRLCQLYELIDLARIASAGRPDALTLVCGDFNCLPDSLEYQLLTDYGDLVDSFRLFHTDDDPVASRTLLLQSAQRPKRLDYIFLRQESPWQCIDVGHVLSRDQSGRPTVYSDHFGVMAVFERRGRRRPSAAAVAGPSHRRAQVETVLQEMRREIDRTQSLIDTVQFNHTLWSCVTLVILVSLFGGKHLFQRSWYSTVSIDVAEHVLLATLVFRLVLFMFRRMESNGLQRVQEEFASRDSFY